MGQDMKLAGDYFGIKYKYPTTFPVNTINCVRVLRVIIDRHVDSLPAAADLFFVRANFFSSLDHFSEIYIELCVFLFIGII